MTRPKPKRGPGGRFARSSQPDASPVTWSPRSAALRDVVAISTWTEAASHQTPREGLAKCLNAHPARRKGTSGVMKSTVRNEQSTLDAPAAWLIVRRCARCARRDVE